MKQKTLIIVVLSALFILLGAASIASAQNANTGKISSKSLLGIPRITYSTEFPVSAKLEGRLVMVIAFLETKPFFSKGMKRDDFVKRSLAKMAPAKIPDWLTTYVQKVYEYHAKGVSVDVVYAEDDGRAFVDICNGILTTYKRGMTQEVFEAQLIPGTNPGYGDPPLNSLKPDWLNIVRKIIDIIEILFPRPKT